MLILDTNIIKDLDKFPKRLSMVFCTTRKIRWFRLFGITKGNKLISLVGKILAVDKTVEAVTNVAEPIGYSLHIRERF